MEIYWSLKQVPELADLTPEQQKQTWRACYQQYGLKHWQSWACLVAMAVLITIAIKFIDPLWGGIIGGGLGGGIWGTVLTNILRPHFKSYVEQNF